MTFRLNFQHFVWYHVMSILDIVKDQPEIFKVLKAVAAGMALSLKSGDPFYVERESTTLNILPEEPLVSDFKTKVFVIVPPQCASACLDALDKFKLFENTTLFGAPSSADSMYMEVRLADLPSGLGKVVVPNKVYVNRARGAGDFYKPDIAYNGVDWTTNILLEQIKRIP